MSLAKHPPKCPGCKDPAVRVQTTRRYTRGGQSILVEIDVWQCPLDCPKPFGAPGLFVFTDVGLDVENAARANAAWQTAFGTPLPGPQRARSRTRNKEKHA